MELINIIREYFMFLFKYLLNVSNYRMYKNMINILKKQGIEEKRGIKEYFLFSLGLCLNDLEM